MSHFLLALVVLGLSVVVVSRRGATSSAARRPLDPAWARHVVVWAGLPLAAALVVTGAVATASGPHPGAAKGVERLGISIVDTVYVHVRVAAAFGIGFLLLGHLPLAQPLRAARASSASGAPRSSSSWPR